MNYKIAFTISLIANLLLIVFMVYAVWLGGREIESENLCGLHCIDNEALSYSYDGNYCYCNYLERATDYIRIEELRNAKETL